MDFNHAITEWGTLLSLSFLFPSCLVNIYWSRQNLLVTKPELGSWGLKSIILRTTALISLFWSLKAPHLHCSVAMETKATMLSGISYNYPIVHKIIGKTLIEINFGGWPRKVLLEFCLISKNLNVCIHTPTHEQTHTCPPQNKKHKKGTILCSNKQIWKIMNLQIRIVLSENVEIDMNGRKDRHGNTYIQ